MPNSNVEELARHAGRKVDIQKRSCIGIGVTSKSVSMTIKIRQQMQIGKFCICWAKATESWMNFGVNISDLVMLSCSALLC